MHVGILCSGISLGHYNPALLIREELRRRGASVKVYVLERYLPDERVGRIAETKAAYRRSFAFALTAQRLAKHLWPSPDARAAAELMNEWRAERFGRLVLVSGFWTPLVEEFVRACGSDAPEVDFCHIDSADSTSWKIGRAELGRHVWLWSADERRIVQQIPVAPRECPVVPYRERPAEIVVHGGGWGIGTYAGVACELLDRGVRLCMNAYEESEMRPPAGGVRFFLSDPDWLPWVPDAAGEYEFPPVAEFDDGGELRYRRGAHYHPMYDLVRRAAAIISKPGGGTLVDSLASGTPLISLEPYGPYERQNAQLWEHLGLGLTFERWKELDYSFEPLRVLADNLERLRATAPAYPDAADAVRRGR